ncbi:MAG: 50S ribosomal protein L10 [Tepidisphaeraceae bacterium]
MSKKIKNLIERELESNLKSLEGVAVLNPVGLDGNKSNNMRRKLHEKGMKMLVVKNSLARRAGSATKIKGFESLLNGPSAIVYGTGQTGVGAIARLLVDLKKEDEKLELRGVFFDGEAYQGEAGVKTVSSFPTREEAIGQIVGALLGPIQSIAGALNQGGMVASLVEAIEKKEGQKPE